MIDWIVKKFVCSRVNKLLKQYESNVGKFKSVLSKWIERIEKILTCLKNILSKLDDNQLTNNEVKESVSEIQTLVKDW